eukprot:385443-Pelagomonas_calceolata.AAC.7
MHAKEPLLYEQNLLSCATQDAPQMLKCSCVHKCALCTTLARASSSTVCSIISIARVLWPQISLPQKKEIILYSKMTDTQLQLNKQMMDRTLMVGSGAVRIHVQYCSLLILRPSIMRQSMSTLYFNKQMTARILIVVLGAVHFLYCPLVVRSHVIHCHVV